MQEGYYHEFTNVKTVSITDIKENFGKIVQVMLHIESTVGENDLTLVHPTRPMRPTKSGVAMEWSELKDELTERQVHIVKVQSEPPKPWSAQIWECEGPVAIIQCKQIRGVPDHSES